MKKRGTLWDMVKDPVCGTRDTVASVRAAWGEAQDFDDFVMMLEPDLLARVAATLAPDNRARDFAVACRKAIEDIVTEYGTDPLRESIAKAGAMLDAWDGTSRITIEDRAELEHIGSTLVQNTEFAVKLDELRNFPAVFDSLFRAIGEGRTESTHPILVRHLRPFVIDTLEAVPA